MGVTLNPMNTDDATYGNWSIHDGNLRRAKRRGGWDSWPLAGASVEFMDGALFVSLASGLVVEVQVQGIDAGVEFGEHITLASERYAS